MGGTPPGFYGGPALLPPPPLISDVTPAADFASFPDEPLAVSARVSSPARPTRSVRLLWRKNGGETVCVQRGPRGRGVTAEYHPAHTVTSFIRFWN